jgi:uncharacterized membrane protein
MISLDMSVEEAAKLVISAGLVTPEYVAGGEQIRQSVKVTNPEGS